MKIDRMKEKMKKIRLSLLKFNNYSRWSIDLNITVCIFLILLDIQIKLAFTKEMLVAKLLLYNAVREMNKK